VAGIAVEVQGFLGPIAAFFGKLFRDKSRTGAPTQRKPAKAKSVAKKAYLDETKVMADVVKQLTEFFKLQEQLAALIREEEEKSQNVYSKVFEMRDVISEEQEKARLKEEAKKRQDAWLHRQEERNLQAKLAAVVATSIFLLYLWLWLLFVSRLGKT